MIHLQTKPARPSRLTSATTNRAKDAARRAYNRNRKVSSGDFDSAIWLHDDVRLRLHKYRNGKCCYCERKREPKREPDIEHFRPKAGVTEDGEHPGYWWLAYEWENLYFSCKACNEEFKKNHFPLRHGGVRARSATDDLGAELPILPDLVAEDPELLIGYAWDVQLEEARPFGRVPHRQRGTAVIKFLGLDRDILNEQRGLLIDLLEGIATKMNAALLLGRKRLEQRSAAAIRRQTARNQEFSGFRRWYFRQVGLGEYVATD